MSGEDLPGWPAGGGEVKAALWFAAFFMVTTVLSVWLVESHETARTCLEASHGVGACSRWGKP